MDTSSIFLDLDELALRGGERYENTYSLEMAPIMLGGQRYDVLIPDGVDVTVDRVAGGYLVEISLVASLSGPCDRCLREAGIKVEASQQEFVPTTEEDWDEADLSPFIEDFVVDVNGLAREATVLALPGQVVCRPDCQGLCPVCGKDLNIGPCECPAGVGDSRWSALKNLKLDE